MTLQQTPKKYISKTMLRQLQILDLPLLYE